jgi:hypothetical protein
MNSSKNASSNSNFTKQANNLTKTSVNTYQKSSSMGKVIFFIVLIIFISFLIYIIYIAVKSAQDAAANAPVIVNDVIDAYVARPAFTLPQVTEGMNHSFSSWIYVKDWNYKFGQYKNILWKGNPGTTSTSLNSATGSSNIHCPSLWLYPLTNSLKVVTSTSVTSGVESCDIQNIPLMSWVHIAYVLNNRTVDIYINGKLERSCALLGIPNITNDPVYMTTGTPQAGFYGKIGKTQYFTSALMPNDVANIYQQGPLGTSQYQVNFFKDGKIISVTPASSFTDS